MAMARSGTLTMWMVLVTFMVVVLISPTSARSPSCSRKPQTFVIYQQAVNGQTTAANTRLVTNSSLGEVFLLSEPTTVAVSATSKQVGTTYGGITQLLGGVGSDVQYLVFDFHIDGKVVVDGYRKVQFKGTILAQGAANLFGVNPTVAVIGGTGDFLYAKGLLVGNLVAGGGVHATYAMKFTVSCERPQP